MACPSGADPLFIDDAANKPVRCRQYYLEHKRLPGYFPWAELEPIIHELPARYSAKAHPATHKEIRSPIRMRSFIRHPSDIPIDFQLEELVTGEVDYLKNVSQGGLAFHSRVELAPGTTIRIKIPLVSPVFQATGKVTWCHPQDDHYEIGVQFLDDDDSFRARMVEQICHIEQYKLDILERDGRQLNGEQAAVEWIEKFAIDFPGTDRATQKTRDDDDNS